MAIYRVQIIIAATGDVPADNIVNVFHISDTVTMDSSRQDEIKGIFSGFYSALASYWPAAYVKGTDNRWKMFNLADPMPRTPIVDDAFPDHTPTATTMLPRETCLCLSWEADRVSGVRASRTRGRTYFGPLRSSALDSADLNAGRPTSTIINAAAAAAKGLVDGLHTATGTGINLVVHSTVDGQSRPVTHGFVDNEFDTQRRRGRKPTEKTRWTEA